MSTTLTTRQRLIEAMQEFLWEKGYEATSPNDVLNKTGIGKGSLYHHFKGKEDLAGCALGAFIDGYIEHVTQAMNMMDLKPIERLEYCIRSQLAILNKRPGLGCPLGNLIQELRHERVPSLNSKLLKFYEHQHQLFRNCLDEAQEQGQLSNNLSSDDLATTIISMMQGAYLVSKVSENGKDTPQKVLDTFLQVLQPHFVRSHHQ